VEDLVAGGAERAGQAAPVAARALHPDHRELGVALGQPAEQPLIARRTVGERQCPELAAALIDQCRGVGVLVNVDADEQRGLLARG
jgi:hypothetical protein